MSIEFDSNYDYARIAPAGAIAHAQFTIIGKARIRSAAWGTVLSVLTDATHYHAINVESNGTTFTLSRNYGAATATIGTASLDEWVSVALVGWDSGGQRKLTGYLKTASGALQKATLDDPQYVGDLNYIWAGAGYGEDYPRGRIADVRVWSAVLSDAEIESEMDAADAQREDDLVCSNAFSGVDIDAALTSTVSNAAYADTWVAKDADGTDGTKPTYSADAPVYVGFGPTLSGSVNMPDDEPSASIAIAHSGIASVENGASVSVTYNDIPAIGSVLIAFVGGWMDTATDIALTDTWGGEWRRWGLQKRTGTNIWVGVWTCNMPPVGDGQYKVTATPNASGNWITLAVHEISGGYPASYFNIEPIFAEGTGTAATVDLPPTTVGESLVLGAVSYSSSANSAVAASGWLLASVKNGYAGLAVVKKSVAVVGNYDPAATLANSDSWIMVGCALNPFAMDVSGGLPPFLRLRGY